MSSGQKEMVIASRERAIAEDVTRGDAFRAAAMSRMFRRTLGRVSTAPMMDGAGAPFDYISGTAPQFPFGADVLGGLFVVPGTTAVTITPGTAGFWIHDWGGSSDDDDFVIVDSAGVSSVLTLPFAANGGAGSRWDLVFAYVDDAEVLEQSSRDIYNPTSGLFSPALQTKVQQGRLKFGYLTGTPGNPIPANPAVGAYGTKAVKCVALALICVPTFATSFAQCDFYDVRPLVSARVPPGDFVKYNSAQYRRFIWYDRQLFPDVYDNAGTFYPSLTGYAVGLAGDSIIGGRLRKNTPAQSLGDFGVVSARTTFGGTVGGDSAFISTDDGDLEDTTASQNGLANELSALAFGFPQGYERFVRYAQSSAGTALTPHSTTQQPTDRFPTGPNGVIAIVGSGGGTVTVGPTGIMLVAGGPPGFNGSNMVYFVASWLRRGVVTTNLWPAFQHGARAEWPKLVRPSTSASESNIWQNAGISGTQYGSLPSLSTAIYFVFPSGFGVVSSGYVPATARRLRIRVELLIVLASSAVPVVQKLEVSNASPTSGLGGPGLIYDANEVHMLSNTIFNSTAGTTLRLDADIPINMLADFEGVPHSPTYINIPLTGGGVNITALSGTAYVVGYEE